jgi:hypothetical protein
MKVLNLEPDQIVTLNDYPLYSNKDFVDYLCRCKRGESLPLVPVVMKETVLIHFGISLVEDFRRFEKENPAVEYFMLDGSHRTTAQSFVGVKIRAVLYESDADIASARKQVASGQILQNATLDHSFEGNCELLRRHFADKPYFMTVVQKTEKMKSEGFLLD